MKKFIVGFLGALAVAAGALCLLMVGGFGGGFAAGFLLTSGTLVVLGSIVKTIIDCCRKDNYNPVVSKDDNNKDKSKGRNDPVVSKDDNNPVVSKDSNVQQQGDKKENKFLKNSESGSSKEDINESKSLDATTISNINNSESNQNNLIQVNRDSNQSKGLNNN